MGVPSSQEASELDKEKMQQFLNSYVRSNDLLAHIPDGNIYRKPSSSPQGNGLQYSQHSQSSAGSSPKKNSSMLLVKRYVFKLESETSTFIELMQVRRRMSNKFLPKLEDYFIRIENGYCQTYFTYHVAFEFADYNIEKELNSRLKNPLMSRVRNSLTVVFQRERGLVHALLNHVSNERPSVSRHISWRHSAMQLDGR